MKNKPKPLLSQPGEKYPDENWLFLFEDYLPEEDYPTKKHPKIKGLPKKKEAPPNSIWRDWQSEVLFYELCRELNPDNNNGWDAGAFLRKISDGQFPETPFLLLTKECREMCVEKMKSPGSLYDTHVRLLKTPRIFDYQIEQHLKDEYVALLEDVAFEAADEESAKREGSTSRDFMSRTNPGERAASATMNRLVADGCQIYEPSQCRVTLNIDLDFPDTAIRQEFAKLLNYIRTKYPSPGNSRRGKEKGLPVQFRRLAAYRLNREFGTFTKIEAALLSKGLPKLRIKTESGWNKAVKEGAKMVERFRKKWEKLAPQGNREVENSEPESG